METTFLFRPDDLLYRIGGLHPCLYLPDNATSFSHMSFGVMPLVAMHWFFYCVATALLIVVLARDASEYSSVFALSRVSGASSWIIAVAMCSIAGVPPFIGFWTKAAVLSFVGLRAGAFVAVVCWAIALSGLLFYINTFRHSVSLRRVNELDDSAVSPETATTADALLACSLVCSVAMLGDVLLAFVSLFI